MKEQGLGGKSKGRKGARTGNVAFGGELIAATPTDTKSSGNPNRCKVKLEPQPMQSQVGAIIGGGPRAR